MNIRSFGPLPEKSIAIKSKHTFFCSFSSILVHPLFLPWVIISAHQQKLSSSFPEVHFYLFTIIAHNSVLWVYYGHCVRMSRRIATFSTARRQRELSTKKMRREDNGRKKENEENEENIELNVLFRRRHIIWRWRKVVEGKERIYYQIFFPCEISTSSEMLFFRRNPMFWFLSLHCYSKNEPKLALSKVCIFCISHRKLTKVFFQSIHMIFP